MNSTQKTKVLYDACHCKDWEGVIALCRCEAKSEGTSNFKATYQDERGRTCLHIAVIKNAPCGVVRAIIDAHKECPVRITRLTDNDEQTALHMASNMYAFNHNQADVLQLLVESDPHCATMPDKYGQTPLHLIVYYFISENDGESAIWVACARAILNAGTTESILSPNSIKYKRTALHKACFYSGGNSEIVQMILERCPQAALAKDSEGNTPLHYVARILRDVDFTCAKIRLLLKSLAMQGQSGAAAVNNNGQTPLHLAVFCEDNNALQLLIESHPKSVCIKVKKGMTPLDLVQEVYAQRGFVLLRKHGMAVCPSPELIPFLKEMCEKCNLFVEAMLSVWQKHKYMTGEKSLWITPEQKSGTNEEYFEHALMHNYLRLGSECPLYFILYLIEMYPHQTQMKDARGDLPLHIALENGVQHAKSKTYFYSDRETVDISSNAVIKGLIDAYPQAAREPNCNGDLPFQILLQNRDGEIGWCCGVHHILRAHPAVLWHERTDLSPVLQSWILSKLGDEDDLSALYEIVKEMPSLCFGATETTTHVSYHMCDVQALRIE